MTLVNIFVTKKNNHFVDNAYVAENEIEAYKNWISNEYGCELNFRFRPSMNEEVEIIANNECAWGHDEIAFVNGELKTIRVINK